MTEIETLQGQATRRDVLKGTLKAGAYAAPMMIGAAMPFAVGAVTGVGGVALNVLPMSGPVGTFFVFSALRFTPFTRYAVRSIAAPVGASTSGLIVTASASGAFSFNFNSVGNPVGTYTIAISPTGSTAIIAQITFIVTTGSVTTTPALNVLPTSGPAGTLFVFAAVGLTANAVYDVRYITVPAGLMTGTAIAAITANAAGQFTFQLDTTTGFRSGSYTLAVVPTGTTTALAQVVITITGTTSSAAAQASGVPGGITALPQGGFTALP